MILRRLLIPFADRHACGAGRALGSWGSVQRPLGLLCAAMGRLEEAEERLGAAIEANRALGWWPWVAWTQCQYAELLVGHGAREDRGRSFQLMEDATELARRLGLEGLEERVRTLNRRAPRQHRPAGR